MSVRESESVSETSSHPGNDQSSSRPISSSSRRRLREDEEEEDEDDEDVQGKRTSGSSKRKKSSNPAYSRSQHSLTTITARFVHIVSKCPNLTVDLGSAANTMGIQKRRLYDILNSICPLGLGERIGKSKFRLCFPPSVSREVAEEAGIDFDDPIVEKNDSNTPLLFSDLDTDSNSEEAKLKRRIQSLEEEYRSLENEVSKLSEDIGRYRENLENSKYMYVTIDDVFRASPSMSNSYGLAVVGNRRGANLFEKPDINIANSGNSARFSNGKSLSVHFILPLAPYEEQNSGDFVDESDGLYRLHKVALLKGDIQSR